MENKDLLKPAIDANGLPASPVLKPGVKNFLIDIDGTICDDVPNEMPERMETVEPYADALEILNKWYDEGHIITFFTSRTSNLAEITEAWLNKCGFKYHGVVYNKPRGGNYHWIDNHLVRATKFKGRFTELVTEWKKVEVFKD